jgi:hypothetical protein
MRRFALLLAAASLAILLFAAGIRRPERAVAITYPAGWNLVSGPGGSTLFGALGNLYTLQIGDRDYQTLPPDAVLRAGWSYWAYFPNGGVLQQGPDAASYATPLSALQWIMLGNPSAGATATVTGADTVLVYTPNSGYVPATAIPPGQGAFVTGAAQATVAVPGAMPVPPTPAPPVPTVVPLIQPALASASLQKSDVFGYSPLQVGNSLGAGAVSTYSALWRDLRQGTPHYSVTETLTSYRSVQTTMAVLTQFDQNLLQNPRYSGMQQLGPAGIGDEDHEFFYTDNSQGLSPLESYTVVFRRGGVVAIIITADLPGAGSLAVAVNYARIVDARLQAVIGR